jgi:hypothetical protein
VTQIVDGFGAVGNIFPECTREGNSPKKGKGPTYSSKTFNKSEAFTTPTILPPF